MRPKLDLAISEQELVETPSTTVDHSVMLTAKPKADVTAKHSNTLDLASDSNMGKLQNDVVAIALVGSNYIYLFCSERKTYKNTIENRDRIR